MGSQKLNAQNKDIWHFYGEVSLPFEGRQLEAELGAKPLALLITLILSEGAVPRDKLAHMLWPGSSRDSARHNLRQALFAIRKSLGSNSDAIMRADAQSVCFVPGTIQSDVQMMRGFAAEKTPDIKAILEISEGRLLEGFSPVTPEFDKKYKAGI